MDTKQRLLSLDTLRGFDMMFIMGVSSLIVTICSFFPGGSDCALATNMEHVDWNGLAHHDTIFPLFLFIAGISWPFSYASQLASGRTKGQIYLRIIKRGFVLVLLGLVYNGLFRLDFQHLRFDSVLARIGLSWMFAALVFVSVRNNLWRAVIAAVLLLGYWGLLQIPAPDQMDADSLSYTGNIVGWFGRMVAPEHLYDRGVFDPEGLLSTFPAIVTAMLGMFSGEYVKSSEDSGDRKALRMFIAAAVMLAIGLLWSTVFPINKKLWTSTFVLVVGAYSLAMFALFYWIIDVKGWKGWTKFFQVIGLNSITIYLAMVIIDFGRIARFFLGGAAGLCPELVGKLILQAGYVAVCWLFLYFLYKKKIFLKV
jgi:Uncharacterized conserved protein